MSKLIRKKVPCRSVLTQNIFDFQDWLQKQKKINDINYVYNNNKYNKLWRFTYVCAVNNIALISVSTFYEKRYFCEYYDFWNHQISNIKPSGNFELVWLNIHQFPPTFLMVYRKCLFQTLASFCLLRISGKLSSNLSKNNFSEIKCHQHS